MIKNESCLIFFVPLRLIHSESLLYSENLQRDGSTEYDGDAVGMQ